MGRVGVRVEKEEGKGMSAESELISYVQNDLLSSNK